MAEEAEEYLAEGEGDEESPTAGAQAEEKEEVITDPSEEPVAVLEPEPEAEGEGAEPTAEAEGEEPEPEPEGEAEPEGEVPPETPAELTPRLVHAAARAGLSDEDVKALAGSAPSVLGKLADSYDAVSRDFGARGKPTFTEQQLAEIKAKGPQAVSEEDDLTSELLLELDPDVYGDEMVEALSKKVLPRIKRLSEEVNVLRQAEQERRAAQLQQQADTFFESISKDYGEAFGKGPMHRLAAGSPEHEARLSVYKEADVIANGAVASGRSMTVQEALDRAVSIVMRDKALEVARGQVAASVQKRARQVISRPTHRAQTRSYRKPEEKAADAVAEKMREMGYSPESED